MVGLLGVKRNSGVVDWKRGAEYVHFTCSYYWFLVPCLLLLCAYLGLLGVCRNCCSGETTWYEMLAKYEVLTWYVNWEEENLAQQLWKLLLQRV